jgi:hypothetical protein
MTTIATASGRSAGPWWGNALRILEPKEGQDAPQMRWLEPRLK